MTSGFGAVLLTRVAVKAGSLEHFDGWQRGKHLVDLRQVDGVAAVSYYASAPLIPAAPDRPANRMAAYWARDTVGLGRFLAAPALTAAVQDGSRFFDDFEPLDGAVYTGNVYELASFTAGTAPGLRGNLLVERYEVAGEAQEPFDAWLLDEHLPAVAAVGLVGWVGWGRGIHLPTEVSYYDSPGNRLVLAELAPGLPSAACSAALAELPVWGGHTMYLRREVNTPLAVGSSDGQGVGRWQT